MLRMTTHCEPSGDWVEADVNLVNKVGRLAHTHERRTRINVVHPAVDLFVGPEGKVKQLVVFLHFDLNAERLHIDTLDIGDIA